MAIPQVQVYDVGADTSRIRARVPQPPANVVGNPPLLEDLAFDPTSNLLTIRGDRFVEDGEETKVIFTFGSDRVEVQPNALGNSEITVSVPPIRINRDGEDYD